MKGLPQKCMHKWKLIVGWAEVWVAAGERICFFGEGEEI